MQKDRRDQKRARPAMNPPPCSPREAGEQALGEKRLQKENRHAQDTGQPGYDVDGLTPLKKRARRRCEKRYGKRGQNACPDQTSPERTGAHPSGGLEHEMCL